MAEQVASADAFFKSKEIPNYSKYPHKNSIMYITVFDNNKELQSTIYKVGCVLCNEIFARDNYAAHIGTMKHSSKLRAYNKETYHSICIPCDIGFDNFDKFEEHLDDFHPSKLEIRVPFSIERQCYENNSIYIVTTLLHFDYSSLIDYNIH
jgi:hypothetical protein